MKILCATCNGRGKTWDRLKSVRCYSCNGTGIGLDVCCDYCGAVAIVDDRADSGNCYCEKCFKSEVQNG